jgi:pyridoxine 5-phosphate synthase
VDALQDGGIPVSLFIEPEAEQIKASRDIGADMIEIHTGRYANARSTQAADTEFKAIVTAAKLAVKLDLRVNAGHGLNYTNIRRLTAIDAIEEYNIGHSIVARAVLVGLDQAVREMKRLICGSAGARHEARG